MPCRKYKVSVTSFDIIMVLLAILLMNQVYIHTYINRYIWKVVDMYIIFFKQQRTESKVVLLVNEKRCEYWGLAGT